VTSSLCKISELWFQDGKETEESHQIHKDNEIVADQLVCFSVPTFGLTCIKSLIMNVIFMYYNNLAGLVRCKKLGFRTANLKRKLIRIQARIL
jgi:hypothetical protein